MEYFKEVDNYIKRNEVNKRERVLEENQNLLRREASQMWKWI